MAIAAEDPAAARTRLALVTVPLAGGEARTVRLGDVTAPGPVGLAAIALSP